MSPLRLRLWSSGGVAIAGVTCFGNLLFMYARHGLNRLDYKPAMDWLKVHSASDSIVYNVSWSEFPLAFVWNDGNRFVWGMDPVFLYDANPRLYWEAHWIMVGKATAMTDSSPPGEPSLPVDTVFALTHEFHASYVVLRKKDHRRFFGYMLASPHFRLEVDANGVGLFKIDSGAYKANEKDILRGKREPRGWDGTLFEGAQGSGRKPLPVQTGQVARKTNE